MAAGRSGRSRLVRVRVQCFPPENRDLVTVREMTEVAPFGPGGHSLLRNSRARHGVLHRLMSPTPRPRPILMLSDGCNPVKVLFL